MTSARETREMRIRQLCSFMEQIRQIPLEEFEVAVRNYTRFHWAVSGKTEEEYIAIAMLRVGYAGVRDIRVFSKSERTLRGGV